MLLYWVPEKDKKKIMENLNPKHQDLSDNPEPLKKSIETNLVQILRKTYWLLIILSGSCYHLISQYEVMETKNIVAGTIGVLGFGSLLTGVIYSHIRENKRQSLND